MNGSAVRRRLPGTQTRLRDGHAEHCILTKLDGRIVLAERTQDGLLFPDSERIVHLLKRTTSRCSSSIRSTTRTRWRTATTTST